MQNNTLINIAIIVLIVLIIMNIGLGTVFSIILYIIGGIILLGLVGLLVARYKLNKIRREFERTMGANDNPGRAYTWSWGTGRKQADDSRVKEGEVKVHGSAAETKRVKGDVGDYVEYEDIKD